MDEYEDDYEIWDEDGPWLDDEDWYYDDYEEYPPDDEE